MARYDTAASADSFAASTSFFNALIGDGCSSSRVTL
jgi:hypothetical protein